MVRWHTILTQEKPTCVARPGPGLCRVHPEGNYIGATNETPYLQTGEVKYGKPILDRIIRKDTLLGYKR